MILPELSAAFCRSNPAKFVGKIFRLPYYLETFFQGEALPLLVGGTAKV